MIGSMLGAGAITLPAAAAPGDTPSRQTLDREINEAENQLEIVVEQYNAVGVQLGATRAKQAAIARALAPTQRAVREAQANVALIAARAYEATPFSTFAALIDAPSAAAAISRLT